MSERTLIQFFVNHYEGHSEVWEVTQCLNEAVRCFLSFDARDGQHCYAHRLLFQTRDMAEKHVTDALEAFEDTFYRQHFKVVRVW